MKQGSRDEAAGENSRYEDEFVISRNNRPVDVEQTRIIHELNPNGGQYDWE